MFKHWRCTTVKTFLLVFKNLETRKRQHWTCNSYNGHSSKKSREKPRGHLQWGYYAGLHLWHRLFSPELFDGGLFGEQHYKFSSALTLCSSSDSLLHWSRQHVCLTLTGHPQIQTLCKEPPLRACVRVCECVCLWGCWSRMLIQWKGAVRDTGGRKKSPESRRTGVVRVCLLQREGGERNGLRNSEVVQESWAEPQCCVDETERVLFTSAERVRPKTSNIVHTQSANVINTSKIESADFCHTVWWLCGGKKMCVDSEEWGKGLLWNLVMTHMGWHPKWGLTYLVLGADTVGTIIENRIRLKQKQKCLWRAYGIHTDTKGGCFIIFILDNNPSVCLVHSGWLLILHHCDNNIEKTATCSPSSALLKV